MEENQENKEIITKLQKLKIKEKYIKNMSLKQREHFMTYLKKNN